MKLERLELLAFGPFTNKVLDFSARPRALQLVYGPNEAGKSSTLRALIGLLYGIDARSTDAHLHEMIKLRVGATLVDELGNRLRVVRRKGNKNTLLDEAEQPIGEGALTPLLGGLDETLFKQMFGLDHERLRQGAEALLHGGGQLGEVLFDASTGGRGVHTLIERLRAEAESLFKQRGRNAELNVALESLKQRHKAKRDAVLAPEAYAAQQTALAAARVERDRASALRRELAVEKSRLTRALQLVPLLARHDALLAELERPGAAFSLAGEPVSVSAPEGSRRPVSVPAPDGEAALELTVQELNRRYGSVQASDREEPQRRSELLALAREIEQLRARLGAGLARLHGLDTASRARIRKLVEDESKLESERAELERDAASALEEQARVQAQLDEQPALALGTLPGLLTELEREDLHGLLARAEEELAKLRSTIARRQTQLGLTLDLDWLQQATLPADERVAELERGIDHGERERVRLARERAQLEPQRARLNEQRRELLGRGELVSSEQLERARRERDGAFDALFEQAPEPPPQGSTELDLREESSAQISLPGTSLEDSYSAGRAATPGSRGRAGASNSSSRGRGRVSTSPARVRAHAAATQRADALADRRYREAQEAAELLRIELALAQLEAQCVALEQALTQLEVSAGEQAERWLALAAPFGLAQHTPRSARPLLLELKSLREQLAEQQQLEAQCGRLSLRATERARELATLLSAAHSAAPAELGELAQGEATPRRQLELQSRRARALCALELERTRARGTLALQLDKLARESAQRRGRRGVVIEQLRQSRERYLAELGSLGVDLELAPAELMACFEELTALAEHTRRHDTLQAALSATEAMRTSLEHDVQLEVARSLPPLAEGAEPRSIEQALAELSRLQRARSESARDHLRQRSELHKLDEQLATLGDGAKLIELRALLAGFDPHAARARLEEIEQLLEEQTDRSAELEQSIGRLSAGLELLEQGGSAVGLAEDYEHELSHARAITRRYVEVRLALSLLGSQVERYRSEHQQPVLKRAAELFPRLTLQRFRGLTVEFDEQDEPVLSCLAGSGKSVGIPALSDGTRDQLYLALRVASIERYFEGRPPLPLILDDALIHFDDARAAAALEVLGELAKKTQVLFFTHHARMVELARAALGDGGVQVHELSGRPAQRTDGPLFDKTLS